MNFELLKEEDYDKYLVLIKRAFARVGLKENLSKMDDSTRILVLKDGNNLVGSSMIRYIYNPIKDKKTFYLDYICVSPDYQNQGIGKKIMMEIKRVATEEAIDRLELTSNSKRCYARKLYISFGMTIRDTDVFEMDIKKDNE